ncbi:uncharacterized protein SAPINGB_P005825 [Magnusiomyces paraingens]|uniref:Ceramide very long chain fatty acid hydroxylase n=1 Tax=Magnusiomyces paraingens TaxID=2606893 RepID=A0A5E8C719_9ASCO|nr:uncharacterized protein SAPINGB_P005825 [Saprochaete ingens]VVT57698.1 unnamed protein product [Saprochaete ingens]
MPAQTVPVITKEELAEQISPTKCLITLHHRKVYDVTPFLDEHPAGGDIIMEFNGKDITDILRDPDSHQHSETAYEMLDEMYFVAILSTDEEAKKILTKDNRHSFKLASSGILTEATPGETASSSKLTGTAEVDLHITTDFDNDYKEHKFIDLNKPLFPQVLFAKYNKEFYLDQVHRPRHYGKGSAPIFGNFMEPFSLTPWYVVPLIWIPFNLYIISICLQGLSPLYVVPLYVCGLFLWTLIEYILHRFLFHIERWLPDHPLAFTAHFLLHGVHHYLPMDRMRLVMPPAMFIILCTPIYKLCHFLFPQYYVAMCIFAGGHMGYIMYDVTHYSLHHIRLPEFMKDVKKHHLDHHYKNYDLGYGVTSKFWDSVFGTTMRDDVPSRLLKGYK